MIVFKIVYWAGLVIQILIRAPFQKTWKEGVKTVQRISRIEQVLLGLLSFALLPPLIYTATNWLDFANYSLPGWMGWAGVFILACSLYVFGRSHADLKSNWSPSLEIFQDHTLVTEGIYRFIRHPMYASQWLFAIAQILILQNWLVGPITLLIFVPFYLLRVRAEEKLMLEIFGESYREYMKKAGAVLPKLH
jgi:protein-S-isoprenylcysteine O-methyltransferase Ste14